MKLLPVPIHPSVVGGTNLSDTIGHALRCSLPASAIRADSYVTPATHPSSSVGTGASDALPIGARLRLNATFSEASYSGNALVRMICLCLPTCFSSYSWLGRHPCFEKIWLLRCRGGKFFDLRFERSLCK